MEQAENTNLQIVIPYLTYYSLLTCSRLAILTSPISLDSIENLLKSPHSKIINVTTDLINKLNLNTGKKFKKLIATCKANRELFSYKFPASGLDLIKSNKNVTDSYYRYCRLLCELAQLNSTILDVLLNIKGGEFEIDGNYDSLFYSCFEYKGIIDNEDYYRAGYISRNIKRPRPLDALMGIGMTEDFFQSWCNPDIEEYENYQYNPDRHTQILFPLP